MQTHFFEQQRMQFGLTVSNAEAIGAIHDPDQGVCFLKVVAPIRSNRLLAADVPDVQFVSDIGSELVGHLETGRSQSRYPRKSMVLMIKPNVGLTVLTSSFIIRLTMVVLPALSSPLPQASAPSRYWEGGLTASIFAFPCLLVWPCARSIAFVSDFSPECAGVLSCWFRVTCWELSTPRSVDIFLR